MNIPNEVLLTSVTAQLSYVDEESEPQEDKPYQIISDVGPHSVPKINFRFRTYEAETITNIRGYEREFALDTHGFSFHSVTTRFTEWDSQELVETKYFQEVENLLKTFVDGADHIEIFDWRRRGKSPNIPGAAPPFDREDLNNPLHALPPANGVHVDQSPYGALKRAKLILGNRAAKLLQGRVRIINVWKPLCKVVEDDPLALCDGRTLPPEALMETDLVRKSYIGSTMFARYRKGYKWYFLDRQTNDEICLFKNFDSDDAVDSKYCPHVSFSMKHLRPDAAQRESVEFRAYVFTQPKSLVAEVTVQPKLRPDV